MSARGKTARRIFLVALLGYATADLFLLHGPLRRHIDPFIPGSPAALARARDQGTVALVGDHPITRSQWDRALAEQLWTTGKSSADLSPDELSTIRASVLDQLILDELLRDAIRKSPTPPIVAEEEINERIRRMIGRFETKGIMEKAMKADGIADEKALRQRIAARIQQEKWIDAATASRTTVSESEAREWFTGHPEAALIPERIRARHIFLPTLDHPPEEAERKLREALTSLTAGTADFATLARTTSEDPATRDSAGDLGWMTRNRLPADLSAPLFSLPTARPTLIRSSLGWHLIEVTDRKPARPRSFEEMKPEIVAALQTVKRREAIHALQQSLRADASAAGRIRKL